MLILIAGDDSRVLFMITASGGTMPAIKRTATRACVIATTAIAAVVISGISVDVATQPAPAAAAELAPGVVAAPGAVGNGPLELVWERTLYAQPITTGSPGLGVLDEQGNSVIVGTMAGTAIAMHTSDGSTVDGWPYSTGGLAITSTPSVAGSGDAAQVFIGVGWAGARTKGGYLALTNDGNKDWYRQVTLYPNNRGEKRGVMSSLSVGNLYSGTDVIGGSMGQMQLAMGARTGKTIPGFPWLMADTNFSTPALAKIFTSDKDYIIEGGDSTAGTSYSQSYKNGGHLRILRPTGNKSKKAPNDGLICQLNTDQVIQSSPAVGRILANNSVGIVSGTGVFYSKAKYTNKIVAMNTKCTKKWTALLDGDTRSSPAIADVLGRGTLDVVAASGKGTIYALNGRTGKTIWSKKLGYSTFGGPTTFQAPGADFQYVLAPTKKGLFMLDGRDGSIVALVGDFTLKSSATVSRNADGSIGITIAGADTINGTASGRVAHYKVVGSSVETVDTPGAWPMFHHDPKLSGYTSQPLN